MIGPACINCGATEYYRLYKKTGLCSACYQIQLKHGRSRSEKDYRMQGGSTGICSVCGQTWAMAKKRCETCYKYWKVYGRDRTRRHWIRPEKCKICGKPETATRRRTAHGTNIVRGRCTACSHYYRRHGKERPESFWKTPYGWCECGSPAMHKDVPLKLMTIDKGVEITELYNLCDDCWNLEHEPLLTRGESKWER